MGLTHEEAAVEGLAALTFDGIVGGPALGSVGATGGLATDGTGGGGSSSSGSGGGLDVGVEGETVKGELALVVVDGREGDGVDRVGGERGGRRDGRSGVDGRGRGGHCKR